AGLLLKSFARLNQVDMGFQAENLLTLQIQLSSTKYKKHENRVAFFDQLLDRVKTLPGVESAGVINGLPVSWMGGGASFFIEGRPEPDNKIPLSTYRIISPDYCTTMKISLLTGRTFTAQDRDGTENVSVISESLAQKFWPNENPLGQRIR